MIVSLEFGRVFGGPGTSSLSVDPGRVAYGVMVGVGFLGAGAILHDRGGIRGLTTAASVWCTAAVGLASGFGMHYAAAVATGIVLLTLRGVRAIEDRLPQLQERRLTVLVEGTAAGAVDRFRSHLRAKGMRVVDARVRRDLAKNLTQVELDVRLPHAREHDRLLALVDEFPDAREVRVE
jgi:putative Mg2+ transporter-C (MgtC) family protein